EVAQDRRLDRFLRLRRSGLRGHVLVAGRARRRQGVARPPRRQASRPARRRAGPRSRLKGEREGPRGRAARPFPRFSLLLLRGRGRRPALGGAVLLGHLRPPLAFGVVLAFAVVRRRLAGAFALAVVDAGAVARLPPLGGDDRGRPRREQTRNR